jgi:hypothetical protein
MNPDWRPGVLGPGDEARFYFDEHFTSVKSLWDGDAGAWALNAAELGLDEAPLPAETNHDTWGTTITRGKGDEYHGIVNPWVAVRVPDTPRVAGRRLQVRVDLSVEFPEWHGARYDPAVREFTRTTPVQLAAPGAGALYAGVWHWGAFAGAAGLGLMAVVFIIAAGLLRRQAFPLKVVRDEDDEDDRYDRPRRRRRFED